MFDNDEPDYVHLQRISRETVEFLREVHKKITTGEIEPAIIKALKNSGIVAKVEEHDVLLHGLFRRMTAAFGNMMHMDDKIKEEEKKRGV